MPNAVKWATPTARTSGISAGSAAAGAGILGSEIDNETNKDRFATVTLTVTHGTAATANRVWLLYLLLETDGATFEDGGASTQPGKMHTVAFPVRAVTTAQRISIPNVPLPPFGFKPLLWNDTDQSGSSVSLEIETTNEEIQ
jgi:hypothetical protein